MHEESGESTEEVDVTGVRRGCHTSVSLYVTLYDC